MKVAIILAGALLLTACFSEDMKSSQNDSLQNAVQLSSVIALPTSDS